MDSDFNMTFLSYRDLAPPVDLVNNPWFTPTPRRSKQCLMFAVRTCAENNLFSVDVSQRIDRARCGFKRTFQTLTPGMKCWLVTPPNPTARQRDLSGRYLLGFEALALQGFPVNWIKLPGSTSDDSVTDPQMMDLAGNAFSGTVFGAGIGL